MGDSVFDDIGDWFTDLAGSENEYKAENVAPDANNYAYGGPGGAGEAANRYRNTSEQAQNRQGVNVDYGQANWDRMQAGQARIGQQGMADAMGRRALGQVPSIARMQADRQMQQAAAAQFAQAGSARGAAGLALAQQGAANNVANAQSSISNQAQINAAQERMAAEQAAFGAYAGMRGGDLASQQQAAQQAQYQAQLSDAQRGRNDAMTMGMSQLEHGVRTTDLAAHMNYEAQKAANRLGADSINAGIAGQNAATDQSNFWGFVGMGRDAAGAGGSAIFGKAQGGPVGAQQPYLVGERGPELIIPAQDGMVIPAGPTKEIVARMFGGPVSGGIDIGGNLGITSDMVNAASTGRMRGGIAGMVGGGGITGGGNVPGGFQQRAEGGPVRGYANSTWGTGGPAMEAQDAAAQAWGTATASPINEAALPMSGGLAVAGFTPGIPMSKTEPLDRRDGEIVMLANAKDAEGVEMTDEERRKADAAAYRQSQSKTNERTAGAKPGAARAKADPRREDTIDRMIKAGGVQYVPMGGYVPPTLIPLAREGGGPVEGAMPLYEPPGQQLHQTSDGHAFFAMAPSRERPLAGGGLAAMNTSPVVARVPVSKSAATAPKKKQSEEEIRRAAARLEAEMRQDHDARMASGPAVRSGLAAMRAR